MARTNKKDNDVNYNEKDACEGLTVRMYKPGKRDKSVLASLTISTESGRLVVYGNAVNGRNGWFFSFPQYKNSKGEYKNLVFALDKDVNDAISDTLDDIMDDFDSDK